MAIEKNQNSEGRFGATSSKTATTILIFSIAMDTDYSFELISIVYWLPQFFMHNKSILSGVKYEVK